MTKITDRLAGRVKFKADNETGHLTSYLNYKHENAGFRKRKVLLPYITMYSILKK